MSTFFVAWFFLWILWRIFRPTHRKWVSEDLEFQRIEQEKAEERAAWFRKIEGGT